MEQFTEFLKCRGIVARDPVMLKLYSAALDIAPTDANVLITGESGTGKDCLAAFIHQNSSRRKGPFVQVNVSAIPPELFESQFFGYEPGAFTGGSLSGKKGLAAQADGGTLFLDEIGELEPVLQSKLLQLVQDHRLRSLGGARDVPCDIRILSATNRNLRQMVAEKQFRLDLYYRLNVVSFDIPPLRSRRQDIPHLLTHLSAIYGQSMGGRKQFTPQAMDYLAGQDWMGNVREMQNFMERLYVLEEAETITEQILKENYRFLHAGKFNVEKKAAAPTLSQATEAFQRQYISQVLRQTGDAGEAAKRLGIEVGRLHEMMEGRGEVRGRWI